MPRSSTSPSVNWVAVDAMGGDSAPGLIVGGALTAVRHLDMCVVLVGPDRPARGRDCPSQGVFGMLPGGDRPALAATIPTRRRPAVMLDVGANVECRPQPLLQLGEAHRFAAGI